MFIVDSIYHYILNKKFNYHTFENILEYKPNNNEQIINLKIIDNESLVKHILNNRLFSTKVIVSLSGGIDSMVLTTILKYLKFNVICIHINYNNREETYLEEQFLKNWCEYNQITLYIKSITGMKRGEIKRSQYELQTRDIRYEFYKEVLEKEQLYSIILAHHKDDIIENIFANLCRGRSILDLAAISPLTCINNVNIIRPLLDFYKSDIYEFAHKYQIPYFKDTTPNWSVRGKYRNQIYPLLEDTFSFNIKNNLLHVCKQSDDWTQLIKKEIINPFMNKIIWLDNGCEFNCEQYVSYNITFWCQIFQNIFYKFGKSSPSKKGVSSFIQNIQAKNVSYISISNQCKCRNINYKIILTFQ